MTQEDKELLLKDLCARLPYGVKLQKNSEPDIAYKLYSIDLNLLNVTFWKYQGKSLEIGDVGKLIRYGKLRYKPYLRPMSSMTEEEEIEYDATFATIKLADGHYDSTMTYKSFDYLNKKHFDYRGLIPKGLALEVTENNNPYGNH